VRDQLIPPELRGFEAWPACVQGSTAGGAVGRGGGDLRVGVTGQRHPYRGRADLLATIGLAGDAHGDSRAGRRGRDRRSIAGLHGSSGLEAFPAIETSGGDP
jgi:hypothetical protein